MFTTKWKGNYNSGRKYNKSLKDKYAWISNASDGSKNVYFEHIPFYI